MRSLSMRGDAVRGARATAMHCEVTCIRSMYMSCKIISYLQCILALHLIGWSLARQAALRPITALSSSTAASSDQAVFKQPHKVVGRVAAAGDNSIARPRLRYHSLESHFIPCPTPAQAPAHANVNVNAITMKTA